MNEKSEIKRAIYGDIGATADDWLESAQAQRHGHAGAKRALAQAAKNLAAIASAVDADLEGGVIPSEPLEVAKYAKTQIQRCVDSVINAARHEENCELSANGAMAALSQTVRHMKNLVDRETAKLDELRAAIASGEVSLDESGSPEMIASTRRIPGARPGPSVAAQRRAETEPEPKRKRGRPKKNGTHVA